VKSIPFARELAAICRADAAEIEDFDHDDSVYRRLLRPGNEPHFVVYQAAAEHRAFARWLATQEPDQVEYLRELAHCLEAGEPSDYLLYPGLA
jgi:hypothetical protein